MNEDEDLDLALYDEALEQEQRELEVSTMRKHRLKTLETYFDLSKRGLKPYEIRANDRLYQAGDILELYCIRKVNPLNMLQIKCTDGVWIDWPTKANKDNIKPAQLLTLDEFPQNLIDKLECLIMEVTFVLPGHDSIGMHDDHVILSLIESNRRLAPYEDEYTPLGNEVLSNMRDSTKETITSIREDVEPIPEGVYFNPETSNFYKINTNKGLGLDFHNKWYQRHSEFPAAPLDGTVVSKYDSENNVKEEGPTEPVVITKTDNRVIPGDVYWSPDGDNFYDVNTNKGMGMQFYNEWRDRWHEFPQAVSGAKPKYSRDGKPKA